MAESRLIITGERIVVVDDEHNKSISGKVIGFRKNAPGNDVIVIEAERICDHFTGTYKSRG